MSSENPSVHVSVTSRFLIIIHTYLSLAECLYVSFVQYVVVFLYILYGTTVCECLNVRALNSLFVTRSSALQIF